MYKNYAIIENETVIEYPVNVHEISDTDLPHNWPGGEINGRTYVFCHDKKPVKNWNEIEVETVPYFDQESGFWYRGYEVQPAPQEIINKLVSDADFGARANINFYLQQYSEERATMLDLSQEQKETWAQFRIDVQNVLNQQGYPMTVTWPNEPDDFAVKEKLEVVRV